MVIEEIEIRRRSAFYTCLVESSAGSLHGVLKMTSSESPTEQIRNICGFAQVNPARTKVYFGKDDLFYYGTRNKLQKNFNRDFTSIAGKDTSLTARLYAFQDRPFGVKTADGSQEDFDAGFINIPVKELGLSHTRKRMLDLLVYEAELALPRLLSTLERVPVKLNTPKERRAFRTKLSYAPAMLMQEAIATGAYYRSELTKTNIRHVKIPLAKVIYNSFVGFPEWMHEYLRRHK